MADSVLYIEDEPDDVFFMQRAFKKIAPEVELRIITNGQDAADFFEKKTGDRYGADPLLLVILDLNLPGRPGLNVLAEIRKNLHFGNVPVLIFSASNQQSDIEASYAAGCNAYLVKPGDPEKLRKLVSLINDFWIKENRSLGAEGGVAISAG